MFIQYANYIGSYVSTNQCPTENIPEYAFIGRSNVGKSSLINLLTNNKKLAKVSSTPGKTQTINYFHINNRWHMVDLPGYGYAKVSKGKRKDWQKMIRNYLMKRINLQCVFLLVDARVPPQQIDLDFADSLGEMRIPFVIVFTKADKRQTKKWTVCQKDFKEKMLESWTNLPQTFQTSAQDKTGREDILNFINNINLTFYGEAPPPPPAAVDTHTESDS